jgi:hypothetical protein
VDLDHPFHFLGVFIRGGETGGGRIHTSYTQRLERENKQ